MPWITSMRGCRRGDADDVDLPGGQLDEEQDVDPFEEHGEEERRPAWSGQQPGQRRQYHPILGLQIGAVHLSTQDRHLMAQHEQFDVLRASVPGELGELLQDLTQEQVHQRGGHARDRPSYR